MTPPDTKKRVSARPAAPTTPKPAAQIPKAPAVPSAKNSAQQPPSAHSQSSSNKRHFKGKKPRIAARRGSVPPPTAASERLDAAPQAVMAPAPARVEAREPNRVEAREPSSAAKPAKPAAARVPPSKAEARAPYEEAVADDATPFDDDDIFGDASGQVGPAALHAASLDDGSVSPATAEPDQRSVRRLNQSSSEERKRLREALQAVPEALTATQYYSRQYGAHGMRALASEVDEFGLDPYFEERARPFLDLLVKRYFRVDVDGAANIPATGRAVMVANRSGTLPWDGLILRSALREARPELPSLRWLAEDSIFHYPFLGVFMNRLGAVRACPENAERLLKRDRLVAAFPEGAQGSGKLFRQRYRLQRFGRGGYVKLALKHGAPIVPTAIIGAEETNPLLQRSRLLGRSIGAEFLPITPTFPWLGPLGLLPAPVKWRIVVGEPIDLSSYDPSAADDGLIVHRLNEQIRSILQSLVEQARASRKSVLFS